MPQPENSTSQETVQLKHLLLDVDFYDKPKVKALAYKHGQLSVHLYVRWLTLMSRASNALVTRDAMGAIALEVGYDDQKFTEILNYCIKTGMLCQSKDEEISNSRVLQDQLSCAVKRKEAKERQSKYRENKRVTNALPTRFPDPVPDPVLDPNKNSSPFELPEISLPEQFDKPATLEWLKKWQGKLKKQNRNLDQLGVDALCMRYHGKPDALLKALIYSCSLSEAKNVYDPPEKPPPRNGFVNRTSERKFISRPIKE